MCSSYETKFERPRASVVICTRNRGELIVDTLETVLANPYPNFELLVIDQSTDEVTKNAVKHFSSDDRLRYIYTDTQGTGVSRYLGLVEATGEYVLYTDDDCTVPPDWVDVITKIFENSPKTAVIFSNVIPGQHDAERGVIPNHIYDQEQTITSLVKYYKSIGMGAGMSVRRDAILAIGGFDQQLGPGSIFRSGEDYDIAVRALIKGWYVHETNQTTIIHDGFRTFDQFRELTERDWFSLGAIYAKTFKSKQMSVLALVFYNLFIRNLWKPFSMLFKLQKPQGFRRATALSQGFAAGLKVPVDDQKILYK